MGDEGPQHKQLRPGRTNKQENTQTPMWGEFSPSPGISKRVFSHPQEKRMLCVTQMPVRHAQDAFSQFPPSRFPALEVWKTFPCTFLWASSPSILHCGFATVANRWEGQGDTVASALVSLPFSLCQESCVCALHGLCRRAFSVMQTSISKCH